MAHPNPDPSSLLKTAQIIVAALVMGLLSFSGVVTMLVMTGAAPGLGASLPGPGPATPPSATLLVSALTVVQGLCSTAAFVMRRVMIEGMRRRFEARELEESQLPGQFMTLTILRAALAEAPALFGTMFVMLTGNWLGFVATACGVVLLLIIFPTRNRFGDYTRDVTGRAPGM